MDLQKLQQRFPLLSPFSGKTDGNYVFNFDNQLYEIPIHTMTQSEYELLRIFSGPIDLSHNYNIVWLDYLTGKTDVSPAVLPMHRLLFLQFDKDFTAPTLLRSVFEALLGKDIILLSLHPQLFVIIECIDSNELLNLAHYLDPIMADLEVHFRIFVSDVIHDITTTKERFNWYVHLLPSIWTYTPKHVLTQQELLVPYVTQHLAYQEKEIFISSILKSATSQPDLLHTIKKLIEYEGNITLASKKMYMHRNTLQNRLEKFQQITQKDIRQFPHRLEVYLAIIFLESL
ncbi:helix-turn-helix domain-containing protein [Lysinibacillus fusiformis]|uniref:PucR family transcriptional regulator n=1 Tax=Lysinibacillus fusiformis TaxID=28031 RepID=UPI00196871BC|nr:helix-turn-helix domain-containing protein [Lysinibacillus fusiformis]QSB12009.1 helix-turn-helix domain-containing protein [Lysinibacillus fusiformis]